MGGDGAIDEEQMSARDEGSDRLAVGHLAFDPHSGELSGPGGLTRIAPQPASLLTLLASRPGELVARDEIRERLWPGGKVEFEQGIAFAVREVRKAIESAGGDPALLETIPKRGLRLRVAAAPPPGAAPLELTQPPVSEPPELTQPPESELPKVAPPPEAARTSPARAGSLRLVLAPLAAVAVVAVVGLGIVLVARPPAERPSIVVFAHDAEDPGHADVAGALGRELTTALTRAFEGELGIVGPTGSTALSGPNDTEGARVLLGACLIVSGGIRAVSRDTVVVFTQVVRTLDRVHAWASLDTVPASASGSVVPIVVRGVEGAAGVC
jgi:DNA-binding winged helix-turn-helix (wHTH) protein/TolB-like protein